VWMFFLMFMILVKIMFSVCRSTYAKTIRDSRRAREREFLKVV
jgi:hypothetical protein